MAKQQKYGEYAFLIGMALAVISGLLSGFLGMNTTLIMPVLVALGLIVGYLNINEKEILLFLVATIALMMAFDSLDSLTDVISTSMGTASQMLVNGISYFFGALKAFIAPAAFVVALKAIIDLAKSD